MNSGKNKRSALGNVSVGRKLLVIAAGSALASTLTAGFVLLIVHVVNLRAEFARQVDMAASLVSGYAVAPVVFGDVASGIEVLEQARKHSGIESSRLVLAEGGVFAHVGDPASLPSQFTPDTTARFDGWSYSVTQPVTSDGEVVAMLAVTASFRPRLVASMRGFVSAVAAIMAVGIAASVLTSLALRDVVVGPIARLAGLAARVAEKRDYSLRAPVEGRDEVGALTGAINAMLARIEAGDRELRAAYSKLEDETRERVRLHDDLVKASRMAGMAEVATGVLHNVGNVLNTVNLTTSGMQDRIAQSRLGHLRQAINLIEQQNGGLARFLESDPRGRALPGFLSRLVDHFEAENRRMSEDVGNLVHHVEHIKEIVSTQQSHARVLGVIEQASIADLIESAVKLARDSFVKHEIAVELDVPADLPPVKVDRHRVVQILVNLLGNAKDAVNAVAHADRRVRIAATVLEADAAIEISVKDRGCGIASADMDKIFRHGFTTKVTGHGFGLHTSALAAREMGGSMRVSSDGPGLGATFHLVLPAALQPVAP
ncbi:hypothetical protein ASA1KI_41170 [Opitutales bacterium ASA1]|uniref:ATP-binding protein n=1 Tax=Congregicoccus parvus TaxID=3081749 RepID=UPI002B2D6FE6|nr:hypothetical protein ASA1KI_41170 [Opitutales bacterium ASA1]